MSFEALFELSKPVLSIALFSAAILAAVYFYAFKHPSLPNDAPPLATDSWPIIGSMQFFTERWSFFQRQMAHSPTGNFSFYAGDKIVVALSGDESRRVFFEHKQLDLGEGYGALLGGSPQVNDSNTKTLAGGQVETENFDNYFAKRLRTMLKGSVLAGGLPQLLKDVRSSFDCLATQETQATDPFKSIYRLVFQMTMRTVACVEIAGDDELREKVLKLFEKIESTATAMSIMYNWMPLISKFRRTYAGAQLYMIFKRIIDKRAQEGRREDDALQHLIDQGDDVTKIITFVLGALFAGQLNSGINAAWMLVYLADDKNKQWFNIVREEVESVANQYCPDTSLSLPDRLMRVPVEAWESAFPSLDLFLKEIIRLHLSIVAFRKNTSRRPIAVNKEGTEFIPADAYAAVPVADIHHNPDIYTNHKTFDPARYLPDRAEDKKSQYGWIGWGVGRHPCLGIRFAKLENNIITAFWVACFESAELVDVDGKKTVPPEVNLNFHTTRKPERKVLVKYKVRESGSRM